MKAIILEGTESEIGHIIQVLSTLCETDLRAADNTQLTTIEKTAPRGDNPPTTPYYCADLTTMQPTTQPTPKTNNTSARGRPAHQKEHILKYAKKQIDITGKIPSAKKVAEALNIDYKTAWYYLKTLRKELEEYQRQHEEAKYQSLLNTNTKPDPELKDAAVEEGE